MTTRLNEAPGALLFSALDNTSYIKHLEHDYLPRELNLYKSSLRGAYYTFRYALRGSSITHTHDYVWGMTLILLVRTLGTIPKD